MGDDAGGLPLESAVQRWCTPALVAAYEASLAAMREAGQKPDFMFSLPRLREHPDPGIREASRLQVAFERARDELHQDLRSRLIRGELALTGVRTKPERHLAETEIPGLWAADFRINPSAGIINCAEFRWVAVMVHLRPIGSDAGDARRLAPPVPSTLSASQVAALDDDTLLGLLEEHAKRVVEGPDAKLIAPGKISLMPIVRRKMLHRAGRGELEPTLAGESAWLAAWISGKVESHQVPTKSTIENKLRSEYAAAKARSNATMPR